MAITINLLIENETITIYPATIAISESVCSDSLQPVENTASATIIYEPAVFQKIALIDKIQTIIKDGFKTIFTGIIYTDISWLDIGRPVPIEKINLSIKDNTYKLEKKTTEEIALLNTSLNTVVNTICSACSISINKTLPDTPIPVFVADEGTSYKQLISDILYSHGYSFFFNGEGEICFFDFKTVPTDEQIKTLAENELTKEISIKKSSKTYDGIKINYNTITEKTNELVYFLGTGYDSNDKPSAAIIQPGNYYPIESSPIVEKDEGQVYQSFESGYSETYQKYNGEKAYRRSKSTTLLYTHNHHLEPDWTPGIVIDRTEYQSKKASVRFKNTGNADALLYKIAIRADSWYRSSDSTVTAGATENPFSYSVEFLYTAASCEILAKALSVYFTQGKYKITLKTKNPITPGSYRKIDTGISGFIVKGLCISETLENESGLYSSEWITIGPAAVDITRSKTAGFDDIGGALNGSSTANDRVDGIEDGTSEKIEAPDTITGIKAVAFQDSLSITANPTGKGLSNTLSKIIWNIQKEPGGQWQEFASPTNTATYFFARSTDGYPERGSTDPKDLGNWRIRAKGENHYGKISLAWGGTPSGVPVITDKYGTWKLQKPLIIPTISHRFISLSLGQPPRADNMSLYGNITHQIQIRRSNYDPENTWYKPSESLDPYTNENNYKEGEGFVIATNTFGQNMPLKGQNNTPDPAPDNTTYQFKVIAQNEAGTSDSSVTTNTATNTNIQDIVKAWYTSETGEKIKVDGALGAENIYTEKLSAVAADMGFITGGTFGGTPLNFWALSRVTLPDGTIRYEGSMRVGGIDQFLKVTPVVFNGNIDRYEIEFKVGNFVINSNSSSINGVLYVQASESSLDRSRITPQGIYFEHRTSTTNQWEPITHVDSAGINTPAIYSNSNLLLTNVGIVERRKRGTDIGLVLPEGASVFHYDTDFFDQNGVNSLPIKHSPGEGTIYPVLKGQYDTSDGSVIDFTPAVLAVAPYSTIAKMLYGNYSLTRSIGVTDVFAVDFWMKYFWNENQELFKIGTETEYVQAQLLNSEPYFNEPLEGEPPHNQAIMDADAVVYNEILQARKILTHTSQGGRVVVDLDMIGIDFTEGEWVHVGILVSNDNIEIVFDKKNVFFDKNATISTDVTVALNTFEGLFCLDEFLLSPQQSISLADFVENTDGRIPWGSLDHTKKWFVLQVGENFNTNIFDTPQFEAAVRKITGG